MEIISVWKSNKRSVVMALAGAMLVMILMAAYRLLVPPQAYPADHYVRLDFSGDIRKSGLGMLDADIARSDIILTGEQHAIKDSTELQLEWIRYLHEAAGVRYILSEMSYSGAELFNEYLRTGDAKLLDTIMDSTKGSSYWNQSQADLWKKLYEYNRTLPETEQLRIVGIDIEHITALSNLYIQKMMERPGVPDPVRADWDKLRNIDRSLARAAYSQELGKQLREAMERNDALYREAFGGDLLGLQLVSDNLLHLAAFIKASNNPNETEAFKIREDAIYSNFLKQHARLPRGKYFGQMGGAHILQRPIHPDQVPFAARLDSREDSPFRNRVLSIQYEYGNSYNMNQKSYKPQPVTYHAVGKTLLKRIRAAEGPGPILFRLSYPGSAYDRSPPQLNKGEEGATTDYIQYIVHIRGSDAALPYRIAGGENK